MTIGSRVCRITCSILLTLVAPQANAADLPAGFVYLQDIDASIVEDIRYATDNNFVGKPLAGYHSPDCILVEKAARALSSLQRELVKKSLTLVVLDCYRPARAVREMVDYVTAQDVSDESYFPNLTSHQLIPKGYIASRSGHSAGGTVDLTIAGKTLGKITLLDMGTKFDFFDLKSQSSSKQISEGAAQNRRFLITAMDRAGFGNYPREWWHFSFRNEPFKGRSFDFPIAKRH